MNNMIDNKLEQIAAQVMGCGVDELTEERYDSYGLKVFSAYGLEYAVGTDEEADEAIKQYMQDSVWSFRPEFIASHTKAGASNGMIKAITALQESCEDCNEDIKSLIEDMDDFIEMKCGSCGEVIYVDSVIVEDGEEMLCPRCHEPLEFGDSDEEEE